MSPHSTIALPPYEPREAGVRPNFCQNFIESPIAPWKEKSDGTMTRYIRLSSQKPRGWGQLHYAAPTGCTMVQVGSEVAFEYVTPETKCVGCPLASSTLPVRTGNLGLHSCSHATHSKGGMNGCCLTCADALAE